MSQLRRQFLRDAKDELMTPEVLKSFLKKHFEAYVADDATLDEPIDQLFS
jgi:hypothetical protein